MRRTTTRTLAVATTLLTTAVLAGCAEELPMAKPEAPVAAAVVTLSQKDKIRDKVSKVVQEADKASEADTLEARLSGPALSIREAELKVSAARGNSDVQTNLSMEEIQQAILPSDQDWPRTSYAITAQPTDQTTPLLMAFDQAAARDPYKLWGWVYLLPGTTMPQFAPPELGSSAVAADDKSLKMAPKTAIEQYASVLTVDARSKYADNFSDDDLRVRFREDGKRQVEAINVEECDGKYEVEYEPTKDPVKSVRTADGGAIVMAAMISQETVTAKVEECKVGPSTDSARALWEAKGWTLKDDGDDDRTNTVEVNYGDMVALYVPPKDSDDRVSLVGYVRVPTSVSNG